MYYCDLNLDNHKSEGIVVVSTAVSKRKTFYFRDFKSSLRAVALSFYTMPTHTDVQLLHIPHIIWFHYAS